MSMIGTRARAKYRTEVARMAGAQRAATRPTVTTASHQATAMPSTPQAAVTARTAHSRSPHTRRPAAVSQ